MDAGIGTLPINAIGTPSPAPSSDGSSSATRRPQAILVVSAVLIGLALLGVSIFAGFFFGRIVLRRRRRQQQRRREEQGVHADGSAVKMGNMTRDDRNDWGLA